MGREFFDKTMRELVQAIDRLATAVERIPLRDAESQRKDEPE